MFKKSIVKRTATVNLLHFVVATIHALIRPSASMGIKCNMRLVILDSSASPDAALNENVHILCNAMKSVKVIKIVIEKHGGWFT